MAETINEPPPESAIRKVPPDLMWTDLIGDGFKRDDLPWAPWVENGRDGVVFCPLFGSDRIRNVRLDHAHSAAA